MTEFTFMPPQCGARRAVTFLEWLRWKILGPVRGFDPDEARCNRYMGHERYGYKHQDIYGREWKR